MEIMHMSINVLLQNFYLFAQNIYVLTYNGHMLNKDLLNNIY